MQCEFENVIPVQTDSHSTELRAVSAALHTPQLGEPTLSKGTQNSSPVTT